MRTYEADLKTRIRKDLKGRGIWFTNIANGVLGSIPGDPDIILCHRGQIIAIEGKSPRGAKREQQIERQTLFEACGGHYYYVRNWEQYQILLRNEGIE